MPDIATTEAIRETLEQIAFGIGHADTALLADRFTSDAVIDDSLLPGGAKLSAGALFERLAAQRDGVVNAQTVVRDIFAWEFDGQVRAYSEASRAIASDTPANPDGLRQWNSGEFYDDVLVEQDGVWRVARRTVYLKSTQEFEGPFTGHRIDSIRATKMALAEFIRQAEEAELGEPPAHADEDFDQTAAADRLAIERAIVAVDLGLAHCWRQLAADALAEDFTWTGNAARPGVANRDAFIDGELATVPPGRLSTQRLTNNVAVRIKGDSATAISEFSSYVLDVDPANPAKVVERRLGTLREDKLRRAADGWVLAARREYTKNTETRDPDLPEADIAAIRASGAALPALPAPTSVLASLPTTGPVLSSGVLADRLAIRQLQTLGGLSTDQDYAPLSHAVLTKDGAIWNATRTEIPREGYPAFHEQLVFFRVIQQHLSSNSRLWIGRDRAYGLLETTTVTVLRGPDHGHGIHLRSGGAYADEYHRTKRGWRLHRRGVLYKASWIRPVPLAYPELTWLKQTWAFQVETHPTLDAFLDD